MLVLDAPDIVADGVLKVPFYHRSHLSLKAETQVAVCYLPKADSGPSELVVSPLPFGSWPTVWRISATFHDAPGVVSTLLQALRQQNVNILLEESSSTNTRQHHVVELVVDMAEYLRTQPVDASCDALRARLIGLCSDWLCFEGGARLKLTALRDLQAAHRRYVDSSTRRAGRGQVHTLRVQERAIKLPAALRKALLAGCVPGQPLRCVRASSTKDRLLRVFFPDPAEPLLFARITHNDQPGALADVTSAIAPAFDLLGSFNRVQTHSASGAPGRNQLEVLLTSHRRGEYENANDEAMRHEFERLLTAPDLHVYDLRVAYPSSAGRDSDEGAEPRADAAVGHPKSKVKVAALDSKLLEASTPQILARRHRAYSNSMRRIRPTKDSQVIEENRLSEIGELNAKFGAGGTSLFLSYVFDRTDVRRATEISIRKFPGVELLSGDGGGDDPMEPFRAEILRRIRTADWFLGIWTAGDKQPSPWLYWELGAAQAYGVPHAVVVHDSLPAAVFRVNSELEHGRFSDGTFTEVLTKTVTRLVRPQRGQSARSRG